MGQDTFIFVAFCVFAFLVGVRLKQRISGWKKQKQDIRLNKNQRPKTAHTEEPPEVRERRKRREKRIRRFTIAQLIVLLGLMVYMIPALIRDLMVPGRVEIGNIFLRCLIFIFTIYIFIIGYLKVFKQREKEKTEE